MKISPLYIVGGLVAIVGGFFVLRKAGDVATAAGKAIDPTSPENLAYRAATKVTETITGDARPMGVQLYEAINKSNSLSLSNAPIEVQKAALARYKATLNAPKTPTAAKPIIESTATKLSEMAPYKLASSIASVSSNDGRNIPLGVRVWEWTDTAKKTVSSWFSTKPATPILNSKTGTFK